MNTPIELLSVLLNMNRNICFLAQMVAILKKQVDALENRICEDDLK